MVCELMLVNVVRASPRVEALTCLKFTGESVGAQSLQKSEGRNHVEVAKMFTERSTFRDEAKLSHKDCSLQRLQARFCKWED